VPHVGRKERTAYRQTDPGDDGVAFAERLTTEHSMQVSCASCGRIGERVHAYAAERAPGHVTLCVGLKLSP
jgi:uncharacterized OB-fold protein